MKSIYVQSWAVIWLFTAGVTLPKIWAAPLADCDKPIQLLVSDLTESGATLSWSAQTNHMGFTVEVRSKGRTPNFAWENETVDTSIRIEGLVPGSRYQFRVEALCDLGSSSGSSSWQTFETAGMNPSESCSKANDLEVMALTGSSAVLTWTGGVHSSHFEIEVRSKGKTPVYFFERSLMDNIVLIEGLVPDGKYQFRVKTTCQNGAFSGSTTWKGFRSTMVTEDTCKAPEELVVDTVTATSATLSWASAAHAEGYEVSQFTSDTSASDTAFMVITPQIMLTSLVPNTNYKIQVKTLCAFGISEDSITANFTTAEDSAINCQPPDSLWVDTVSATEVSLLWSQVDTNTVYQITWGLESDTGNYKSLMTSDTMVILDSLQTDTQYFAELWVLCDEVSSDTLRIVFKTLSEVSDSCITPTGMAANDITAETAVITWNPTETAVSYVLALEGPSGSSELETTDTSYLLTGLEANAAYMLALRALCSDGSSEAIQIDFSTPQGEDTLSCETPSQLTAEPVDTSYLLSWNIETSADSFQIEVKEAEGSEILLDSILLDPMLLFTPGTNTIHEFRVQAFCGQGDTSQNSAWLAFPALDSTVFVCDPPSGLNVDTSGSESAQLSWSASSTSVYQIEVHTGDSTWSFILESDSTQTTLMLFDLDPGSGYSVRVRAVCENENSDYTDWVDFETQSATSECAVPSALQAQVLTDSSVLLHWSGPDTALYQVEIESTDTSSLLNMVIDTDTTSVEISGLVMDIEYRFRVLSICGSLDSSDYSDWFVFMIENEIDSFCFEPFGLDLDTVGLTLAGFSWEGPDSATYQIQIESIDSMQSFTDSIQSENTHVIIEGLTPGTSYRVHVKAICEEQESQYSDWLTFATLADSMQLACSAPENLIQDSLSSHSVSLSWTGPDSAEYEVMIARVDTSAMDVIWTGLTDHPQVLVEGLSPSTSYTAQVRSICAGPDTSDYSDLFEFTTLEEELDSCTTPIGQILEIGSEEVLVSWSRSSADALYLIEVEHLGLTYGYNLINTSYDTSYLIHGLVPGGTYQWKITAFCSVESYSECSPWMAFTTESDSADTSCVAPHNLSHSEVSPTAVLLTWSGEPDHFDYEVEVQNLDTTPFYSQINITTDTTMQIEWLSPGGSYQFKVNALCHSGELSEDSEWYEFSLSGSDSVLVGDAEGMVLAYPNPVIERMTIEMPEDVLHGTTLIELTDLTGRVVWQSRRYDVQKGDQIYYGVSHLREGVYKLMVRSATKEYHQLVFVSEN